MTVRKCNTVVFGTMHLSTVAHPEGDNELPIERYTLALGVLRMRNVVGKIVKLLLLMV